MRKNLGSYVTSFSLYKFLQDISNPITSLDAYRLGIVDSRGKQLKEPQTEREKQAYSPYHQMIIMVKKVFDRVPDPRTSSQLKTLMGTIQIFSEEVEELGGSSKEFKKGILNILMERGIDLESHMLSEEITNIASSGAIAGMGYEDIPPDNVKIQPRKKKSNGSHCMKISDPNEAFRCMFGKKSKKSTELKIRENGASAYFMRRKDA